MAIGNRNRILGAVNRLTEARARAMARALEEWLLDQAVREANAAIAELRRRGPKRMAKALDWDPFGELADYPLIKAPGDERLRAILRQFGLRAMEDAAGDAEALVRGRRRSRVVIASDVIDRFMATKEVRLQQIQSRQRRDVRNSVRDLIRGALAEIPQPSTGEIARRIRTQFHGQPGAGGRVTGVVREGTDKPPGLLTTDRISTDVEVSGKQGILYAFSSERAALIARTEVGMAVNTGTFEGYKLSGVTHLKWLPVTRDRRSGARRHWKMADHPAVAAGERFTLPDGVKMLYPHDPAAPIHHLANCRCTHRPVRVRKAKIYYVRPASWGPLGDSNVETAQAA